MYKSSPKYDKKIYDGFEITKRYSITDLVFHLNESISRILGALGMFINRELAKNVIRRRASKF